MKQICGSLKLELAQYREVAAFAAFGSDLDATTVNLLNRGVRLIEVLKQSQYKPLSVAEQVVVLFAATKGFLDKVAVSDISAYEVQLVKSVHANNQSFLDSIESKGALDDAMMDTLSTICGQFGNEFKKA